MHELILIGGTVPLGSVLPRQIRVESSGCFDEGVPLALLSSLWSSHRIQSVSYAPITQTPRWSSTSSDRPVEVVRQILDELALLVVGSVSLEVTGKNGN